jgi:hypothetical protein
MATGAVDWLLGSTGSTARESAGDYSLVAAAGTARWWHLEHHAHFEDDGLLYMFDNGDGRQRSRALAVDVDESTGVATIEREVDLSEFITGGFTGVCTSRGGTFRTPLDHLLITCGTRGLLADYDAHDTLVWSLSLTGARGLYRATPVYDLGH